MEFNTPDHCGACNHSCAGGACELGVCQPLEVWAAPMCDARGVTIADDQVVWLVESSLDPELPGPWKMSVAELPGGPAMRLAMNSGQRIAYRSPKLFWTYDNVRHVNLSGAGPQLTLGAVCKNYFTLDDLGRVYCRVRDDAVAGEAKESIKRLAIDLTGNLISGADMSWTLGNYTAVTGMVAVGPSLYFGRSGGFTRLPLDPDGPQGMTLGSNAVLGDVVSSGDQIYFAERISNTENQLMVHEIGTLTVDEVYAPLDAFHLHIDDVAIFAAGDGSDEIRRLNKAMPALEAVWNLDSPVRGIAGTAEFLFVTTEDCRLHRIAK